MSSKVRCAAAFFSLTLFSGLLPLLFGASAASAAICTGGTGKQTQSSVVVLGGCTKTGGDGLGTKKKNPLIKTIKRYPDRACVDSNGRQSYMGVVWDPRSATSYEWCLLQAGGGGANVIDNTQLQINAPKPTANFSDRFLTGAEVTFSVPEMTSYVQSLRQFPGATIVATPTKMTWNFGDGTTSTELEPKHTFLTTTPDPSKPNDRMAHVQVTGTWHLYLHPADEGVNNPVQDLGEVTLTGQLDRPIVEVWSAQTEPR